MRFAILSDIHGNLEALQSVLKELDRIGYDALIVLGDVVGYGADPSECIEIVKRRGAIVVKGNHDEAVVNVEERRFMNIYAKEAIEWTTSKLNEAQKIWLKNLPYRISPDDDFEITHAEWENPENWTYIFDEYEAKYQFKFLEKETGFYGHTHIPAIFQRDREGNVTKLDQNELYLLRGHKYMINPGSVGQPRDRDWRASFGIFDTDEKYFELHRIEYDVKTAMKKIIDAGLPEALAYRLEIGY